MPAPKTAYAVKRIAWTNLISLAYLNMGRHGVRAVANIAGIGIAVAALVFFLSFFRGTYEGVMFSSVIDYATSHGQFMAVGFDDDDPDAWLDPKNLFDAGVAAVGGGLLRSLDPNGSGRPPRLAPRLVAPAFAGDGSRKAAVTLAGVDFGAESEVLLVKDRMAAGSFGPGGVVIGKKLAETLSLSVGDEMRIQASAADGSGNLDYWRISGIFSTAYPPMDRGVVMMDLAQAQDFLGAGTAINKIYCRLAAAGDSAARERALSALASDTERGRFAALGLSFRGWTSYARSIVEDARKDRMFFAVFIAVLLFLSLSTIAGTMRVTVFERKREIGMLRASGWLRGEVARLFLFEALIIGIAGSLAGCLAGGAASLALQLKPIAFGASMASLDIPAFSLTCDLQAQDFAVSLLVGLITATLAGIAPALSGARMPILSALAER